MITFPISIALAPYAIVCLFCAVLAAFAIFHFIRYSETTAVSFVAVFAYLAGTTFILFFTWSALANTDWNQPLSLTAPFTSDTSNMDLFAL